MQKVLIVEDDPNVASLVAELLKEEGFVSVTGRDAEWGWASAMAEDPDAMILDIWLHGEEAGWNLLKRIRGNDHFESLPVVVLTGIPAKEAQDQANELGAELVSKPFTPAVLMDRLRRAMRRAGRSPGVRSFAAVLLTPVFWIEGTIHVPEELTRFSDAWEALVDDTRAYVPVTDALVRNLEGKNIFARSDLIQIRKDQITIVLPAEEQP
jgi:DNA-binding response OmpR family regulator